MIETLPFGELLQTLRKRRKLSQQALADSLGVHRNTVSAWERGVYLPDARGIVAELGGVLDLGRNEVEQLIEAALLQGKHRMSEEEPALPPEFKEITKRMFVDAFTVRDKDAGPMSVEELLHRLDIMAEALAKGPTPKHAANVLRGVAIRLCQFVGNEKVTAKVDEIVNATMEITGI